MSTKNSTKMAKVTSIINVKDEFNFRLDKHVIPTHYQISLEPCLESFTFTGHVEITLEVLENSKFVRLNCKDLELYNISICDSNNTEITGHAEINTHTEIAKIIFDGQIGAGVWTLKISFNGTLNDSLKGFYRSFWVDKSGTKHVCATTQFESTDARRCFPCFDEPEFKATYKVILIVPRDLTALSNGRVIDTKLMDDRNKKRVEFATTMKMSTYLLAFIVGEFEASEPVHVNGIELKIWANPGKKHLMDFALKSASHAISWFEEYYQCKYPGGDKIDFIAINDFAAGAMENLGCITFRETALLVDENTATQAELERVAEVVMHELAHMWFGDLVTMKWWNGLWLNESFATFMEEKALDNWRKHWKIWDKFAVSRAAASRVDALLSTHPIECEVIKPEDAAELFDVISYEKGCSTLYQIEQFMGEEIFRQGIIKYLRNHAFNNTQTHDLWDSLEEAAKEANLGHNIREIMDKWVFTAGHPVLTVSKSSKLDGFVEIEQKVFKFLETKDSTLWPVPVTMKVVHKDKTSITKFLLDKPKETVYVGEDYEYVVLNAGGTGFYRVLYDKELLSKLSTDVVNNLSVVERFNLVNDTYACAKAKLMSALDYLDLIKLFSNESDPSVWAIITGSLSGIQRLLPANKRDKFNKMVSDLIKPAFNKLGYEPKADETVQLRQLRNSLLSALGTIAKDKEIIEKCEELFELWSQDSSKVDSNIVPAIVSTLAVNGDDKTYKKFKQLYQNAKTPQESNRFMYSLADFAETVLLKQTLESCLNNDFRTQDAPYVVNRLLSNEFATNMTWEFIKENWQKIVEIYPVNGVVRMVGAVSFLDSTKDQLTDVKNFFTKNKVEAGTMALSQAMEQQLINFEMREHNASVLLKKFS